MTLTCKICKFCVRSSLKAAVREGGPEADVLSRMAQHLGSMHKDHAANLAATAMTLQSLASTFLLFQYAEIPAEEGGLRESYRQNRLYLFAILESDPLASPDELPSAKALQ